MWANSTAAEGSWLVGSTVGCAHHPVREFVNYELWLKKKYIFLNHHLAAAKGTKFFSESDPEFPCLTRNQMANYLHLHFHPTSPSCCFSPLGFNQSSPIGRVKMSSLHFDAKSKNVVIQPSNANLAIRSAPSSGCRSVSAVTHTQWMAALASSVWHLKLITTRYNVNIFT